MEKAYPVGKTGELVFKLTLAITWETGSLISTILLVMMIAGMMGTMLKLITRPAAES
jgi:hypothetical protein